MVQSIKELKATDPRFVEFVNKMDIIRDYHQALNRYGAGWFNELLAPAFPETYIPQTTKYNNKHRYNRHARELQKPSGYPEEFEFQISNILQGIIFDKTEEDWKEDKITVSESGQVTYSAEHEVLIGKLNGQTFGDREKTRIIFSNGEYLKVKVMTFEIVYFLYFGGFREDTLVKRYDSVRKTICNHRDKGLCDLYQLYTERSQAK